MGSFKTYYSKSNIIFDMSRWDIDAKQASQPFAKKWRKIYFPTGIIYACDEYFISYGQGDYNSYIIKIKNTTFDKLFDNVTESSCKLTIINTDTDTDDNIINEYDINQSAV
jgi:hypothetical protein